jgi:biofilm protein TabA
MILDRLDQAARYEAVHPLFKQAFDLLRSTDWGREAIGSKTIIPDRLKVIVMDVTGKGRDAARLETHECFIDIQYTVRGAETIGWSHTQDAGAVADAYNDAKDIAFWAGRPSTWLELPAGCFGVFFPEDAHAPVAGAGPARKVVVKVAV